MNIQRTLLIPLALAAVLTACNKTDDSAATSSTPTPAATAATAASTTTATPAAASTPVLAATPAATTAVASTTDSVGIPECDDYIDKVQACLASHVPEGQRTEMENVFKMQRDSFRQSAANPQAKAILASRCTAAAAQAKNTYAAYGCSF